jgi:hypothetical protein
MGGRYWLTPPDVYEKLNDEFKFDFDPCPNPVPPGFDGLTAPWGQSNFINPPFRKKDSLSGNDGPTAFVHRAIGESLMGKGSVLILPVQSYVMLLVAAGAEIRPTGRVRWLEVDSKKPTAQPSPICTFILPGAKQ